MTGHPYLPEARKSGEMLSWTAKMRSEEGPGSRGTAARKVLNNRPPKMDPEFFDIIEAACRPSKRRQSRFEKLFRQMHSERQGNSARA